MYLIWMLPSIIRMTRAGCESAVLTYDMTSEMKDYSETIERRDPVSEREDNASKGRA